MDLRWCEREVEDVGIGDRPQDGTVEVGARRSGATGRGNEGHAATAWDGAGRVARAAPSATPSPRPSSTQNSMAVGVNPKKASTMPWTRNATIAASNPA